eukprot:c3589_g1_i1 orf=88-366(+)
MEIIITELKQYTLVLGHTIDCKLLQVAHQEYLQFLYSPLCDREVRPSRNKRSFIALHGTNESILVHFNSLHLSSFSALSLPALTCACLWQKD